MNKSRKAPVLLLLPGLFIMIATVMLPILRTFVFSLQEYNLKEPDDIRFIGLKNYVKVLGASDFHLALKNSLWIMLFVGIFTLLASLFVALLLNRRTKVTSLLTAVAIIPWALPPLVNGMMWNFIFYPGYGLMNRLLIGAGLIVDPISFTTHPFLFLIVVSVATSWRVVPFCALLILANLQSIPSELYDAAKVDGSSRWQSFRKITFPLILPSLSVVLVKILMAAMNIFDEVIAMVGFRLDSQTLLVNNYLHTFSYLDFGYGSAITYVIMLLSAVISYFYIKDMTEA
ncbi:MAG: sugar ABC transporter permease [Peptoniphilus sp.]|nr:sugar ABC transporter permease [Peptoniphilus sp.]MDD7363022.1 sugar ABC transporter permease [Bacillota bacterium]MDY6045287.1 sugar ABC transporter permease [Peptoniphilus sp.]